MKLIILIALFLTISCTSHISTNNSDYYMVNIFSNKIVFSKIREDKFNGLHVAEDLVVSNIGLVLITKSNMAFYGTKK